MITATLNTRKPVVKLKVSDFRTLPIWEFATDEEGENGQDERWVRPVQRSVIPHGACSQLAAADFTTACCTKLHGFMIVTTAEGEIEISPGAVLGRVGYKSFSSVSRAFAVKKKYDWAISEGDPLIRSLGCREHEIFPLRYALRVVVRGEKAVRAVVIR